jgi:uncharacterized protein (TIGR00255 family)
MTGFGKASSRTGTRTVSVEIKSVNHRFLEISCRIGPPNAYVEDMARKAVSSRISRGKVDLYMSYSDSEAAGVQIRPRYQVIESYEAAFEEISERYGLENDVRISDLAALDGTFEEIPAEISDEEIWKMYEPVLAEALDRFVGMRASEGEKLKIDLLKKADELSGIVDSIEELSHGSEEKYLQKLKEKMEELLGTAGVDEARILEEAALYADRTAIDEEIVRLRSHFSQVREILSSDGPSGRKLDFLVQEMNREANTIGSKTDELEVTNLVLELKTGIEKMREQIQNIE